MRSLTLGDFIFVTFALLFVVVIVEPTRQHFILLPHNRFEGILIDAYRRFPREGRGTNENQLFGRSANRHVLLSFGEKRSNRKSP